MGFHYVSSLLCSRQGIIQLTHIYPSPRKCMFRNKASLMNDVLNVNNPRLRILGKQYTLSAAALRNSQTRDCEKPARNGLPIASPNEFYYDTRLWQQYATK